MFSLMDWRCEEAWNGEAREGSVARDDGLVQSSSHGDGKKDG